MEIENIVFFLKRFIKETLSNSDVNRVLKAFEYSSSIKLVKNKLHELCDTANSHIIKLKDENIKNN